jgi:hypothetical protein
MGIGDLKHLSEQVEKHEASAANIENDVTFNIFGAVNIRSQLSCIHSASQSACRHKYTVCPKKMYTHFGCS